jgi:hypothetical protein
MFFGFTRLAVGARAEQAIICGWALLARGA